MNCMGHSTCSISTDTYDFEKYLDSITRKPKLQSKVKTVGTDTCDLDSHFDYYRVERTAVIKKTVATDCADLNFRRLANRKRTKDCNSSVEDLDYVFSWNQDREPKTYSRCSLLKKSQIWNEAEKDDSRESTNALVTSEENKENYESIGTGDVEKAKEIIFESSSSSDESDVDLITSSKVSKCRKLARSYNLALVQLEVDNERIFKCSACGKTFPKKHMGILHLGDHIEDDKYKCLSCDNIFSSLEKLTFHVKEAHRGLVANNSDNILDENERTSENNVKINTDSKTFSDKTHGPKPVDKGFQCVLCINVNDSPSRFASYKSLYLHKRLKHGVKEGKLRSKVERKPRIKREFVCLFCGKEFKSNKALNDHLPVHTGEKNYLCDICKKSYTTSANLQIHKRTHIGLKNFKCTVCDKAFHKKDSLKVHFRKHSGERPFQCDLCPMRFHRNFILKNHRLRHFSEKSYICPVCGKAFTTHGGLKNHEKSHNKDPEMKKPRKPAVKPTLDTENAVICDVCGKVYSTRSNLRIHKFVHLGVKPFQCPVCQQSYAKKDSMLTHMRKHTDERPFACETCGMAFYRNHTLKTHRLRHTGERPHKCHMCGKSFTQSSSLSYHIKHHKKKEEKKKVHYVEDQNKVPRKKKFTGAKSLKAKETAEKCDAVERVQEVMSDMVVINDENDLNYPEKNYSRTTPLMVPVIKKEVLVFHENLAVDPVRKDNRQPEVYDVEKGGGQFTLNKFNYYIAKNHVLSLPKDAYKPVYRKGQLQASQQNVLPIKEEILNATFISDENGEVIPFSSMTLQSVNAENIMIGPLIKVENGEEVV